MKNHTNHIEKKISEIEGRKTVIVAGVIDAALGLLYSSGFEFGIVIVIVIGLVTGALFGVAIGIRMIRRPPKMLIQCIY